MRAVVLGAAQTGNIGDAIVKNLLRPGDWEVTGHNCWDKRAKGYRIPDLEWAECDALVVTLGKEGGQPWFTTSYEDHAAVIEANLLLPLAAIHAWTQKRHLNGTCVVIGSYAHDHPLTRSVAYCTAKAGLAMAIRSLGWDLTGRGLWFHIVHPYHVPSTPMGQRVVQSMMDSRGMSEEEARDYQFKDLSLEEHLTPDEIAEYVGWLVRAPEARWLSGQGLNLYGGVR